ncbi:MAG: hypothetical protein ABI967_05590 [bacterium]
MQLLKALTIALTCLTFFCGVANSQVEDPHLAPTGLSLQIDYYPGAPPSLMSVPAGGVSRGAWFARFKTVAGWQLPVGEVPVRAVNIIPRLEDDVVAVTVSVFQGVKYHDHESPVATYRIRENETVSIAELRRFGLEPFRIGVVRITPAVPAPPLVKSRAKSLEVVAIEPAVSTLPSYKLTLHNLSDKDISAFSIDVFVAARVSLSGMPHGNEGLPLISAGGFYQSNEPIVVRARPAAAGYTPDSPAQETIISAVVFTDGSYEGDPARAADSRALTLGRRLAIRKLLPLFTAADNAATSEQTQSGQMATLRSKLQALSDSVDDQTLAQLNTEFPGFHQDKRDELKSWTESYVHLTIKDLLKEIDAVEAEQPGGFDAWYVQTADRYRKWLARLQ